jgi:hypothetical protein
MDPDGGDGDGSGLEDSGSSFLNGGIEIDVFRKIISLNHLGFPQIAEPVPEGVDIFALMNISAPSNVSLVDNWVVMINPNSSKYQNLKGVLDVSKINNWLFIVVDPKLDKLLYDCLGEYNKQTV